MVFEGAAEFMYRFGFLDVLLPFILSFTITYAFLQKTNVLGKQAKRNNAIVALAFGLIFIAFFDFQYFMSSVLYLTLFIIAIFSGLLLLSVFGGKVENKNVVMWTCTIVTIIIATYLLFDYSNMLMIIINPTFILIGVLWWFIYYIIKGETLTVPGVTPSTPTTPSTPSPTGPDTVSTPLGAELIHSIPGEELEKEFEWRP